MGLATVIIMGGQIPPTCPSRFHLGLLHTILDECEISIIRPALSVSGLYQINNQFSVKIGVEHLHNLPVSDITLVNIGIEYNF